MRRYFLSWIAVLFLTQAASAQSVEESYSQACTVRYAAGLEEGRPFVAVTVLSRKLVVDEAPLLLMKTFDGRIIRSEGRRVACWTTVPEGEKRDESFEFSTLLHAVVRFPLTEEEVEMLSGGIAKIRLSTLPQTYECSFRKDRIGRKLHALFREAEERVF